MLITKNWCKRFLALACALVCVFVLSIPSFAEVSNLTYDECVSRYSGSGWGKGYSRTGSVLDIDVSFDGASEEAKEAWILVMQDWLNDPDYAVIFCLGSSSFGFMQIGLLILRVLPMPVMCLLNVSNFLLPDIIFIFLMFLALGL